MNKVFGKLTLYSPVRKYGKRTIISYGFEDVGDGVNATWYEIYFSQKVKTYPTIDEIKESILTDINSQTDEKILKGFVWNNKPVWLSSENQFNFKAAYDLAIQTQGQNLPLKFKLGENEDNEPVYHTFSTVEELNEFYLSAIAFIQQCLNEGWKLKDSIDFSVYKIN